MCQCIYFLKLEFVWFYYYMLYSQKWPHWNNEDQHYQIYYCSSFYNLSVCWWMYSIFGVVYIAQVINFFPTICWHDICKLQHNTMKNIHFCKGMCMNNAREECLAPQEYCSVWQNYYCQFLTSVVKRKTRTAWHVLMDPLLYKWLTVIYIWLLVSRLSVFDNQIVKASYPIVNLTCFILPGPLLLG